MKIAYYHELFTIKKIVYGCELSMVMNCFRLVIVYGYKLFTIMENCFWLWMIND